MIWAMLVAIFAALVFSLYKLFVANDALMLGAGLLRTALALLGLMAIRFDALIVLAAGVMLFAVVSVLVLAIARNEVQIKND